MFTIADTIRRLQSRIRGLEGMRPTAARDVVSCGCLALDRLLPGRGVRRGSLAEWLLAAPGGGAATLALTCARHACRDGGELVVLDRQRQVYPPALAAWGVDLARVILVYPRDHQEEIWAWEQALRCPGVAAVWGWVEQLDDHAFRRWQLAAEGSGGLGLLIRPASAARQPSWADVRWWVEPRAAPAGRRVHVALQRCRGGAAGGSVDVEWDEWTGRLREVSLGHETHARDLVAQLARATVPHRPTGTAGAGGRAL